MDGQGLLPAALDAMLTQRSAAGLPLPRLLYSIPTGQNPTGAVMGPERMRQVYELARKWGLIILEDDAYFWLQYPQGAQEVPGLNLRREWGFWGLGGTLCCACCAVAVSAKVVVDTDISRRNLRRDGGGRAAGRQAVL
jgi:bifunctional pyridoxal-dependent enzyme with beta-cystathionase and maltose regulon repressor activities